MKNNIKFHNYYIKPKVPGKLEQLQEMAQNVWSTWDTEAYQLFSRIDPTLFREFNHNPVKLLQMIPESRLEKLAQEKGFLYEMRSVYKKFKHYLSFTGHYFDDEGKKHDFAKDFTIAYFSMEYGLHESLPIYSGGLGILSGDHLKAASDLGLPLIGFGLLYRNGYFSQSINLDGMQEEIYEENEWYSKPIRIIKDENNNDLTLRINLRGEDIYMKVWCIDVGKIPLYLLDTNLEINKPHYRKITDYLYDADKDTRILQEIILAFGSLELIDRLEINPSVYHMNEGLSAFLILRRLRKYINEDNFSFEEASDLIRTSSVFTTHTPVPAGNEKFDVKLVHHYLEDEVNALHMDFDSFLPLAQVQGEDLFSLPALAIRFSHYINGVSKLHSEVSQQMWHSIYPDLHEKEMPIDSITNGVHVQSWISRRMTRLFDRYMGSDYRHKAEDPEIWENILSIPDNEVWEAHQARKSQMITFVRNRLKKSIMHKGSSDSLSKFNSMLDRDKLIIGFARRYATYKRGTLILQDKERLLKLLRNERQPVQFIFAGKAHPADDKGKAMIKELIDFARENNVEDRFVFIENYDINIARHIVQGVDVWLNNPIKPNEASGTSGMKAGMNGVLNFSILDGWWPECFNGSNGLSIDTGEEVENPTLRDKLEANEIYDILENDILPLYYDKDQNGLSNGWVKKMKNSIYDVGKGFNLHRMLRDYIDKFYLPEHDLIKQLASDDFSKLHEIQNVKTEIEDSWHKIKPLDYHFNTPENRVVNSGDTLVCEARIEINGAKMDLFDVEIFRIDDFDQIKTQTLKLQKEENNIAFYKGSFKLNGTGKLGFNIRIKPKGLCCKAFNNKINWFLK